MINCNYAHNALSWSGWRTSSNLELSRDFRELSSERVGKIGNDDKIVVGKPLKEVASRFGRVRLRSNTHGKHFGGGLLSGARSEELSSLPH